MFDWLEEGISEFIINTFSSMFTNFSSVYNTAIMSPSAFNKEIWDAVVSFNKNAVLPIAWSILSLFLLLELASLFKRADVKGMECIYWICQILLKIMFSKIIMENMTVIIDAIFEISAEIVSNSSFTLSELGDISASEMGDALSKCSTLTLMGYFITSMILSFGAGIARILAEVIVKLRFIEIYVFTGVAAIPFATLASQEYGVIGKNFIKRMCALALYVIFIVLVLYMYGLLMKGSMPTIDSSNPMNALYEGFGYTVLVVIALFQTGSWSKSLIGV